VTAGSVRIGYALMSIGAKKDEQKKNAKKKKPQYAGSDLHTHNEKQARSVGSPLLVDDGQVEVQ